MGSRRRHSTVVQNLGVVTLCVLFSALFLVPLQYYFSGSNGNIASYHTLVLVQGNRAVNIYILNVSTSTNSAVWDRSNLTKGVIDAVADAINKTHLKVVSETFKVTMINSSAELLDMVSNGANYTHSIFINAHGEVLPVPDAYHANWQAWIDKIAENCRNYGWIWAQVAGYPFYYIGNIHYWQTPQAIGPKGLQRFLADNYTSAASLTDNLTGSLLLDENHVEVGFNSAGFLSVYSGLRVFQRKPLGSNPIETNFSSFNLIGYVGAHLYRGVSSLVYSAGILMNGSDTGVYVHSGLAPNAANVRDQIGNPIADYGADDWLKGYAAAAIGIEEARRIILQPVELTEVYDGGQYSAGFAVQMFPGAWKFGGYYGWDAACLAYLKIVIWGSFPPALTEHGERASYAIPTLELTGSNGENEIFYVGAWPYSVSQGDHVTVTEGNLGSNDHDLASFVITALFPLHGSPALNPLQDFTINIKASLRFRFDYSTTTGFVLTEYHVLEFIGKLTFTMFL